MNFIGMLTLLFIGLKLTAVIDWSWWFVLMPLYVSVSLPFLFFIMGFIYRLTYKKKK
jgi:predicted tellurium resistance membrane protein TerC